MRVIHINKNNEVIKDISGIVIQNKEFYQVLNAIQQRKVERLKDGI